MVYFFINPIGLKLNELLFESRYSLMVSLSPFKLINSSSNSLSENSSEFAILEYKSGDR